MDEHVKLEVGGSSTGDRRKACVFHEKNHVTCGLGIRAPVAMKRAFSCETVGGGGGGGTRRASSEPSRGG